MTIREKLQIIGQVIKTGALPTTEVIKEVKAKEKSILGGFIDLFGDNSLSNETRISTKLLEANIGWVYKNNDVIAKEVGNIEFELFSMKVVGGEIVFNPIVQHPLLDALDRFNEFTAAADGFYTTQSHRKLTGDAFWFIDGEGPNIKGIYILTPDKVELKLGKEAGTQRIIEGYEFKDTIQGQPVQQVYDPKNVIHFKIPNPKNSYRGIGAVEVAADAIDTDNYAMEAQKAIYKRGVISNFALSTPNKISPEQMQELRAELKSNYGGIGNAWKPMILSGDLKPQSIQMSNREMEFIAQQEWLRDKIMSIFGNNRAVLGITDDVNRSNAESTILMWKRSTVRSEMKGITDTLNEFLVPRFGKNLVLTFKDPVQEDRTSKIADVKTLLEANVITQNEAREELGMDTIKDPSTDTLRQPLSSTTPIPEIPKALQQINIKRVLRRSGLLKKIQEIQSLKETARPLAEKLVKTSRNKNHVMSKTKSQTVLTAAKVWGYYEKQMSLVETLEKVFHDKVERFIDQLIDKALSNVPTEVTEMQHKQLLDEDDELSRAVAALAPILHEVAAASGNLALDLINYDKPYIPTEIRSEIEKRVELFAKSMIETDRNKLIDLIAQGVNNGESIAKIRQNITDNLDGYSKMQAERITRTEVLNTSNKAAIDAWDRSGVVEAKQWLVSPGAGPECEIYSDKIIPLHRNFFSDRSEFATGDPPIHPNCRCTVIPVLANSERFAYVDNQKDLSAIKKQTKDYMQELKDLIEVKND